MCLWLDHCLTQEPAHSTGDKRKVVCVPYLGRPVKVTCTVVLHPDTSLYSACRGRNCICFILQDFGTLEDYHCFVPFHSFTLVWAD